MLRGRHNECAALDALLDGARDGRSGVLVLTGEAGVGKTALLEYAAGSASDMRVVHATGVEAEMELAFAILHQLYMPLLGWLERLPGPQRDALATAFGLRAGPVPDRFFVALAMLGLLSEAGSDRPLLCVIDDAQWLDRASAQVLAFVGRRILAEPVAMVFGARELSQEFADLPVLPVEGLGDADARALLASVIPGRLDERIADQIVAETRGNPLALLELPRGLSPAHVAGGFGLPGAVSLGAESNRASGGVLRRYPRTPGGFCSSRRRTQPAIPRCSGEQPQNSASPDRRSIRPSATGCSKSTAGCAFAIRSCARPSTRRRRHTTGARRTGRWPRRQTAKQDPDRRAWHRAKAAGGPDENVAAELERAAGRAETRGGLTAAAAFLERAAELTPEPASRAQRALAAAQTKYEAGALDDALVLLAGAEQGPADDLRGARVHLLRAQIAFASTRGSDVAPLLLRAAREFEPIDPGLARATYLEAFSAALFAGRLARGRGVIDVAEAVRAGPPPAPALRPRDLLLHGLAVRFTEGYAAGAPILKAALSAFRADAALPADDARWLWFACWVAADLWDDASWDLLSARQLESVRAAGALSAIPFVLTARSAVHLVSGDIRAAASQIDEIRAVSEATGIAVPPYGALWLAALRGARGGGLAAGGDRGQRGRRPGRRVRAGRCGVGDGAALQRTRPIRGRRVGVRPGRRALLRRQHAAASGGRGDRGRRAV